MTDQNIIDTIAESICCEDYSLDDRPAAVKALAALRSAGYVVVRDLHEQSINMPVFVDDDPPAWHDDLVNPMPKRHAEFIPHTRQKTPWFGADCPDCAAEFGVHDRRDREMRATEKAEEGRHG